MEEHDMPVMVQEKLSYAGLVLLAFELLKGLIVEPIKAFYDRTTFGPGLPFKSYEIDVQSRHKNEFEACLLYLKDFMEAINADDLEIIQQVRTKRNLIAHELSSVIDTFEYTEFSSMLSSAREVLFKISNYRVKMEIAADPKFRGKGINWETVVGPEYLLFAEILEEIDERSRRIEDISSR